MYFKNFKTSMKEKKNDTDGKIHHFLELEESILSKWLYYPRQSTDSMQPISNYKWHFSTKLEYFFKKFLRKYKDPDSQSNTEKEKWSWKNQAPRLQTILQSRSNQNSITLTQKQKYRSTEQDRKHGNQAMYLWSINLQKGGKAIQEKKDDSLISGAGKTGWLHVKEWN